MLLAQSCSIEIAQPRIGGRGAMTPSGCHAPWRRIAVLHGALAVALGLLLPMTDARSNPVVVWEGDDQAVLLAPQDDQTAPPNDHPVNMAPQEVAEMLAGLRLRHADETVETPPVALFNKDQVDILGEALAAGLARAGPSQDVTFSTIGAHRLSPGAFARRNRLTAGRAFFREGKLNLIFGEIQSPYRKKNVYGRIEEDFRPRKYGRRSGAEAHESILVANTSVSLREGPEGARGDWVVFDPELAGATSASPSTARDRTVQEESQPAPARSGSGPRPVPAGPAGESSGRLDNSVQQPATGTNDIEQRLETLKRLREKALISEEAYRKKVDEILEEL